MFTDAERMAIVAYWNAPGRYAISAPPAAATDGPWQVRLTPEGSTWLMAYQRALRGPAKSIPPSVDAHAAADSPQADWEKWVTTRVAFDRYQATLAAAAADTALGKLSTSPLPAAPAAPGPIPAGLLAVCGNPPAFASAVAPLQYTITFDDAPSEPYVYTDHVKMRDRFAYYRFDHGVAAYGQHLKDVPQKELDSLFQKAGFTPSEQRAFTEVSGLEGGFEAVNTYDTGYVSVGFIQFITLDTGKEDLARVLQREKNDAPKDFANDFHRFGIDVQPAPENTLTVVDPATGAELTGRDAVLRVIEDKRLIAVFQRAGRHSAAFRVAQIVQARESYWPADDPIQVTLPDGTLVSGKVSDLFHSEAGMATLVDRKVNTGHLANLNDAVARVMAAHGCKTLTGACPYEREIVAAVKYRRDFLADPALSQPPPVPASATASAISANP